MFGKVKGLVLVSPLALALNAVAADMPTVKVELRGDLVKTSSDNDTNTSTQGWANKGNDEGSPTRFSLPYSRLDIKGKYNDSLSYRVKLRLNKVVTATTKDSSTGFIDQAYVEHSVLEGLKLKFGKQLVNYGGWEGTYSTKDFYSTSLLNDTQVYSVGAGATYGFQGHSLNVQLLNNSFEQTNSSTYLIGFQFIGSFVDGMVMPILSYHQDMGTEQTHTATNGVTAAPDFADKYTALGVKFAWEAITAEVDYLNRVDEPQTSATTNKDDKYNSLVLNASYKYMNFKPQVKYAQSVAKPDNSKSYDRTDWSVAVEYFPFEKMDFNYHVAYNSRAYDYVAAATKDEEKNELVIGFTGSF